MADPELIARKLRRLRGNMSLKQLSGRTAEIGYHVGERTIQLLETRPGRIPDLAILEALAEALGVPPEEFHEWPIAKARAEAAASPEGERRRAKDSIRKAAARQQARQPDDSPATPQRGRPGSRRKGRAA